MQRSVTTRGFSYRNLFLALSALLTAGVVTIAVQDANATPIDTLKLALIHLDGGSSAGGGEGMGRLHDRDTHSDYHLSAETPLVMRLDHPAEIRFVKIHGPAPYRLGVDTEVSGGWQAIAGLSSRDLSLLPNGWNRLEPAAPVTAAKLRFRIEPIGGASTGVREIEVWGTGARSAVRGGAALLAALQTPIPPGQGRLYSATPAEGTISAGHPVTFTFTQNRPPEDFKNLWLTYEISGETHWVAAVRAIGGHAPRGGHLLPQAGAFTLQLEPVNPQWLLSGDNRITFSAAGGATTSYTVRNVNLVGELEDGSNFAGAFTSNLQDGGNNRLASLSDGDPATGWKPRPNGNPGISGDVLVESRFDKTTQVDSMSLILAGNLTSTISIDFLRAGTWTGSGLPAISGSRLAQGVNTLPSPSQTGVEGIRLRFSGASGNSSQAEIRELFFNGSGVGPTQGAPALHVAYPDAGQFWGRYARIRGFLTPIDNGSGKARITIGGMAMTPDNSMDDGAFEMTVNKDDVGLNAQADNEAWSVEVKAVYPDGSQVKSTVALDRFSAPPVSTAGRLLPAHKEMARPGQAKKIGYDGAVLTLGADAVAGETELSIRPLALKELAALDPGMDNVTAGPRAGYRFGPHPFKFKSKISVTLPYDPALIPRGLTANDIHTFYFDDMAGSWKKLPRLSHSTTANTVTSATTHFTDMINATITMPDHPNPASFDANTIKGIKAADPGAKINLIEPPGASQKGDAVLSYPIEIPPGRNGMQPSLNVVYNSSGGNGWMGLGWDISGLSAITVDTRWGVPRYDSYSQTETYLLDGQELSRVGHVGPRGARTRSYKRRVEGLFDFIESPDFTLSRRYWSIMDKEGITKYYGGCPTPSMCPSAFDSNAVLSDPKNGNIFKWLLRTAYDMSLNVIRFDYDFVNNPVGEQTWRQVYPRNIRYSGKYHDQSTYAYQEGAYEVRFVRKSQFMPKPVRPDVIVDARPGFKTVTDDLLADIEVHYHTCNDTQTCDAADMETRLIRSYHFEYVTGPYTKTLLKKITQCAPGTISPATPACPDGISGHVEFNHHEFEYYDDQPSGGNGFDTPISIGGFQTASGSVPGFPNGTDGPFTSIFATSASSRQNHLYIGLSTAYEKEASIGVKVGSESSTAKTHVQLLDLDGDGLVDQVYNEGGSTLYRKNLSLPGQPIAFDAPRSVNVSGLTDIGADETKTTTNGLQAFYGGGAGVFDHSSSRVKGKTYFADVNGDGRSDLVSDRKVYYNQGLVNGTVTFQSCEPTPANDTYDTTMKYIGCSPVPMMYKDATSTASTIPAQDAAVLNQYNLIDPVRKWVAPYKGTVSIAGQYRIAASTPPPADGVRLVIEQSGKSQTTGSATTVTTIPHIESTATGWVSFSTSTSVAEGDNIYFRVNSLGDAQGDAIDFDPTITYTSICTGSSCSAPDATATDTDGRPRFVYQGSGDFAFSGSDVPFTSVYDGIATLSGIFSKPQTSDQISLRVMKHDEILNTDSEVARLDWGTSAVMNEPVSVVLAGLHVKDRLTLRFESDTRVSWAGLQFVPKLTYNHVILNGVPRNVNGAGNPAYEFSLPYSARIFPRLTAASSDSPVAAWKAPANGTLQITQTITVGNPGADFLTVSVKRIRPGQSAEFIAKKRYDAGSPSMPFNSGIIAVAQNDLIFLEADASTSGATLTEFALGSPTASFSGTPQSISEEIRLGLASDGFYHRGFSGGFRNWYFGEYNGNQSNPQHCYNYAYACYPVNLNLAYLHAPASSEDAVKFAAMRPAPASGNWQLRDPAASIGLSGMSATRLGDEKSFDFATTGGSLGGDQGVIRSSSDSNSAFSITYLSFGPGESRGDGGGDVDFMDLNGDSRTDVVSGGLVQGSYSNGARFSAPAVISNYADGVASPFGRLRQSSNKSYNITLGATTSRQIINAVGKIRGIQSEQASYNITPDGSASMGESRLKWDLSDINGDGLPDLVASDGGPITARLNLGYEGMNTNPLVNSGGKFRFGAPETWNGASGDLQYDRNVSAGVNLSGSGSTSASYSFGGGESLTRSINASETMLIDINGDGLLDYARKPLALSPNETAPKDITSTGTALTVRLGRGSDFGPEESWVGAMPHPVRLNNSVNRNRGFHVSIPVPIPSTTTSIIFNPGHNEGESLSGQEMTMADINGDGFPDQVLCDNTSGTLDIALNKTSGRTNRLKAILRPLGGAISLDYARMGNTRDDPHSRWALTSVIVSDGHAGDGVDTLTMRYSYEKGVYDRAEREFYGYTTVAEEELPAAGGAPYRKTITVRKTGVGNPDSYYTQGLPESVRFYDGDNRLFRETLYEYRVEAAVTYGIPSLGVPGWLDYSQSRFPALARVTENRYEGGAQSKSRVVAYDLYDSGGNPLVMRDFGEPGVADDRMTVLRWNNSVCGGQNSQGLAKPTSVKVCKNVSGTATCATDCSNADLLRKTEAAYNSLSSDPSWVHIFHNPSNSLIYNFNYDGTTGDTTYGNLTSVDLPTTTGNNHVNYGYDSATGGRVASVSQFVSGSGYYCNSTDQKCYRSSAEYDSHFGAPTLVTDVNGNQTLTRYDEFGRVEKVFGPDEMDGNGNPLDENRPTIAFEYHPEATPPYALTRHFDSQHSDPIETVLFTDGLGRVIQTKKDAAVNGADMMTVSGCANYDAFGRPVTAKYPVAELKGGVLDTVRFNGGNCADPALPLLTEYDPLDRVTRLATPDPSAGGFAVTQTVYGFGADRAGNTQFVTTITDPGGNVKRSYRNIRNLITTVKEYNDGADQNTSYLYDPVDQITDVYDAKNQNAEQSNHTRIEYDMAGRRTAIDNPDAGRTEWIYDTAGNVATKTTANLRTQGKTINYLYDNLNRPRVIRYPDPCPSTSSCGYYNPRNVYYQYGAPDDAPNLRSRLKAVIIGPSTNDYTLPPNPVIRDEFQYDKLGQVINNVRTIKDGAGIDHQFSTSSGYDTWGRMLQMTLPDGETLFYGYDSGGNLSSVSGVASLNPNFGNRIPPGQSTIYASNILYDKFGQRTQMTQGNGVITNYSYDASTRRLNNLRAQSGPAGLFQNLNYSFDPVGNITALANAPTGASAIGGPMSATFGYDDLYRLTSARGAFQPSPDVTRRYRLDMAYDSIHNITSKNQTDNLIDTFGTTPQPATTYAWNYSYGGSQPHAPTFVGSGEGGDFQTFGYDFNGNHIITGGSQLTTRTLDWDEENRLLAVHPGDDTTPISASYQYDAGGERTIKRVNTPDSETGVVTTDETIYVSPNYVVRNDAIISKSYFAGTQRIATRVLDTTTTAGGWSHRRFPAPPRQANTFSDLFYFHPDHLGSTGYTTDDQGQLYEHIEYFPFGETWLQESTSTVNNTPYLFTGKELDQDTGYYYHGARYYDPRVSVWQSGDPKDQSGSGSAVKMNSYQYGQQNPLQYIDPDGRDTIFVHGTWAEKDTFSQSFKNLAQIAVEDRGNQAHNLPWSGYNDAHSREIAGIDLALMIIELAKQGKTVNVVTHSHGGNVFSEATHYLARYNRRNGTNYRVENAILFDIPVTEQSIYSNVINHLNTITTLLDGVQNRGGSSGYLSLLGKSMFNPYESNADGLAFIVNFFKEGGMGEIGPAGRTLNGANNIVFDKAHGYKWGKWWNNALPFWRNTSAHSVCKDNPLCLITALPHLDTTTHPPAPMD